MAEATSLVEQQREYVVEEKAKKEIKRETEKEKRALDHDLAILLAKRNPTELEVAEFMTRAKSATTREGETPVYTDAQLKAIAEKLLVPSGGIGETSAGNPPRTIPSLPSPENSFGRAYALEKGKTPTGSLDAQVSDEPMIMEKGKMVPVPWNSTQREEIKASMGMGPSSEPVRLPPLPLHMVINEFDPGYVKEMKRQQQKDYYLSVALR